jgi:hypothetical protein
LIVIAALFWAGNPDYVWLYAGADPLLPLVTAAFKADCAATESYSPWLFFDHHPAGQTLTLDVLDQ